MTLSLVLQIIQWLVGMLPKHHRLLLILRSNSDLEAERYAISLQDQVEKQVQGNSDTLSRLERLEPLPDDPGPDWLSEVVKKTDVPAEEDKVVDIEDTESLDPSSPPRPEQLEPLLDNLEPDRLSEVLKTADVPTGQDKAVDTADAPFRIPPTAEDFLDIVPKNEKGLVDLPRSRPITPFGAMPRRFEVILSTTRVYSRVRHRGVDDATSITSTRSRG